MGEGTERFPIAEATAKRWRLVEEIRAHRIRADVTVEQVLDDLRGRGLQPKGSGRGRAVPSGAGEKTA